MITFHLRRHQRHAVARLACSALIAVSVSCPGANGAEEERDSSLPAGDVELTNSELLEAAHVAYAFRGWEGPRERSLAAPWPSEALSGPMLSDGMDVSLTLEQDEDGHASTSTHDGVSHGEVTDADHGPADAHDDRFKLDTLRLWGYRDHVPGDHSDVFGIEADSSWGMWGYDFTNISYIEVADYPRAIPGRPAGNLVPGVEPATGITDLLTAILASRQGTHHGRHHFAIGAAFQFPTASADVLGSGKWAAGPAIEYEYHNDRFFAAFVALQLWSFAGDSDRKQVNMMMIKPMITYDLTKRWKAIYMPYGVSVYWDKPIDDAVYLPLGGGIQHSFDVGDVNMGLALQAFSYVLRPASGSEWELRLLWEFNF